MENSKDTTNEDIDPPIKYLLIGNIDSNKIITEYSSSNHSNQIKKEINQIFSKLSKTQIKKYNERNKITSKDSIYYYIIEKPNLIFIVLVDEDFPEDLVFELIGKIQKEEIIKNMNKETQDLNSSGRIELLNIINIFQKKSKEENDDIFINVNNKDSSSNEKRIEQNMNEDIEELQTKTDQFLLTDDKNKWKIKNLKIWKNYRTWLFLAMIILIILIIFVFLIYK